MTSLQTWQWLVPLALNKAARFALRVVLGCGLAMAALTQAQADDAVSPTAVEEKHKSAPTSRPTVFRTICVRLCDGYFWPISERAGRDKFGDDAKACTSQCALDARLFYLPFGSRDVAASKDLEGRSYGKLKNAFAYKRTLSPRCTCKPAPWSRAAAARHAGYAQAASKAKTKQKQTARKVAKRAAEVVSVTPEPEPTLPVAGSAPRQAIAEIDERFTQDNSLMSGESVAHDDTLARPGIPPNMRRPNSRPVSIRALRARRR